MRIHHHLRVLSLAFAMGCKQVWATKIELLGSYITYVTIMVMWGGIIKMLPKDMLEHFGTSVAEMIWYLGATEWILFACPGWGFKQVQNDFMSEQAHLALLRPYPESLLRVALWGGESIVRFPVMAVIFALSCWLLSGTFMVSTESVLHVLPLLPMACLLMYSGSYMVGVTCLWVVQSEPVFWVWQKSIFLLGAMIWPMVFYPQIMQTMMWATPFPAILAAVGECFMGLSAERWAAFWGHQLLWSVVFLFLLRKMDTLALRRIQRGGV